MSEFSQDYDYPTNEKKPVLTIRSDRFWYKNNPNQPSAATIKLSQSSGCVSNLSTNRSASFGSSNDCVSSGTDIANKTTEIHQQKEQSILDIPLPPKNGVNYDSIYYDLPKNIPVNPRFAIEKSPSMSHLPSRSYHLGMRKPEIPRKSSFVREKMFNYKNTLPNYQNIKPYLEQLRNNSANNRTTNGKSPPKLPVEAEVVPRPVKNEPNQLNSNKNGPEINENRRQNILVTNDYNDDDEDSVDGDYDYDYVCLESKKKLDDDDQKIKRLLSKESQSRYQRLVLSSHGDSKSFLPNSKSQQMMRQYYRPMIMEVQDNLQRWTEFTVEILKHQQHKPEVYFNFVKHILLSGQNLLSIFKMAEKHSNHQRKEEVQRFSAQFFELLKQIVVKTKKASGSMTQRLDQEKSFAELIDCLQCTARMARECPKII